jgi:hypothetical protein
MSGSGSGEQEETLTETVTTMGLLQLPLDRGDSDHQVFSLPD